jgi:hypothetical protein
MGENGDEEPVNVVVIERRVGQLRERCWTCSAKTASSWPSCTLNT